MNKIMKLIYAMLLSIAMFSAPAFAGSHANPCNPCGMQKQMNPCNPCSMKKQMNPCNPCSMKKHMNPCNPCSMKKHMNPCNPCSMKKNANPCGMKGNRCSMNPCAANKNTPIRKPAFDNFQQAASLGAKMWKDESLGTSGMACLSCHADHDLLNLDRNQNFPHFVKMVGDVVTLDQMINYCMLNPMKGKQFDKNSKELTAMAAYYRSYRMQYMKEQRTK